MRVRAVGCARWSPQRRSRHNRCPQSGVRREHPVDWYFNRRELTFDVVRKTQAVHPGAILNL